MTVIWRICAPERCSKVSGSWRPDGVEMMQTQGCDL